MVFKKMRAKVGLGGGASVDAQLQSADVQPGGSVSGQVVLTAGDVQQEVNALYVQLEALVEVEYETSDGDGEYNAWTEFGDYIDVSGPFTIQPGANQSFPFTLPVPIDTPFNVIRGQELPKCQIGVRTSLDLHRARDKGDLDPIRVHSLPVHESVLDAVQQLGFRFKGADFEKGKLQGSTHSFYQEVEFHGSPQFRGVNELEVTFLPAANGMSMEVLFEVDNKGGFLSSGGDRLGRISVPPQGGVDPSQVQAAIESLTRSRGLFG